jgi:hypothetical protein
MSGVFEIPLGMLSTTGMRIASLVFGSTMLVVATSALSNPPTAGLLFSKKEADSLTYQCTYNGDYIDCDFVQVVVRRKKNPSDVADAQTKARASYPDLKSEFRRDKECREAEAFAAELQGILPKGAESDSMKEVFGSTLQKTDLTKMADAMLAFCKSPTEENFLNLTGFSFDIEARTCSVISSSYKQRFKQVYGSDTWTVVQDGPQGVCGIVNVSRFEPDATEPVFWKYFAKKVVTNKSGELLPGASCSGLDESEFEYNWRSKTVQLGCDYIEFH